jgi:hypothetical protein
VEEDHRVVVVHDECERPEEEEDEEFAPFVGLGGVPRLEPGLPGGEVVLMPGYDKAEGAEDLGDVNIIRKREKYVTEEAKMRRTKEK